MAGLSNIYFKKETLETLLKVVNKKGEKGVQITVSTNDETRQYGQNVSSWVAQSKEDREAGKERFYTGNGSTFWTDGKMTVAEREQTNSTVQDAVVVNDDEEDLPF